MTEYILCLLYTSFNGIAACNEIIYETELSPIQFEGKEKIIAEMKILRAFYYYPVSYTHLDLSQAIVQLKLSVRLT